MGRSKVIVPRKLVCNPAAMVRAITNGFDASALAVQIDFQVTVQTWSEKPSFSIEKPNTFERIISTGNGRYAMLNEGTKAHDIYPKRGKVLAFRGPFRAKTVPNQIVSRAGGVGNVTTFSRGVHHPGTEARNWDKVIAKKHRRLFRATLQRAIDAAVS